MNGIGLIMAAFHKRYIKDKFMDGRESKERYQKIQIFDVFQLVVGLIGTALCWKSVIFKFEFFSIILSLREEILNLANFF